MENFITPMYDDMGIAGLNNMGVNQIQQDPMPTGLPSLKDIAENVAKQKAKEFAISKGLPTLVGDVVFGNPMLSAPLGIAGLGPAALGIGALQNVNTNLQTSLFGRSKTIADFLQAKRDQKLAMQVANRGAIKQNQLLSERLAKAPVTLQDTRRGGQYENQGGQGGMSANASTGTSAERGAALHG
tara:strand:- start:963 stop:1517 length:555 start_codon:yes stop_codon:yes gene_type:complete